MKEKIKKTKKVTAGQTVDINEFRNLQELYIQTAKKLKLYQKLKSLFSLKIGKAEAMKSFLGVIRENFSFEAGSILLVDEKANDLYFAAAFGDKADEIMKFRVAIGKGIAGHTVIDKTVIAVSDVAKDARFDKTISQALGFKTKSILALPIISGIRCLGVFELINKSDGDIFTNEEINTLKEMADNIGIILNNHSILKG